MSKAKTGTYLVEFIDGTQFITGNNYKSWWMHSIDFFYRVYRKNNYNTVEKMARGTMDNLIKSVKYSGVPYVDDGGLKWASLEAYQEVIDEEAAKQHQTFTPLKDIKFTNSPAYKATLRKKFRSL